MATDAVSAFAPLTLNFSKDSMNGFGLKCDNELIFDEAPSSNDEHHLTSHVDHHKFYKTNRSQTHDDAVMGLRENDELQSVQIQGLHKDDFRRRNDDQSDDGGGGGEGGGILTTPNYNDDVFNNGDEHVLYNNAQNNNNNLIMNSNSINSNDKQSNDNNDKNIQNRTSDDSDITNSIATTKNNSSSSTDIDNNTTTNDTPYTNNSVNNNRCITNINSNNNNINNINNNIISSKTIDNSTNNNSNNNAINSIINNNSNTKIPTVSPKSEDEGANMKKKRNTKKRNRSDMPPDELMKLRERERKAQQSRRDRIRAQKRNAQGWHDDDAAWEAFLDQAESNNHNNEDRMKHLFSSSSAPPSMVCSISSRSSPKDEVFQDDLSPTELSMAIKVKTEYNRDAISDIAVLNDVSHHHNNDVKNHKNGVTHPSNDVIHHSNSVTHHSNDMNHHTNKPMIQKQDSVHSNDTDTNSHGSFQDNVSTSTFSSDDKPSVDVVGTSSSDDQKENGRKKLSRRHYLPSEELERLRKRERETKRRQRERHRLANIDSTSPVKSTSTVSSNDTNEFPDDHFPDQDLKATPDTKPFHLLPSGGEHFKPIEQHQHTPTESPVVPIAVPPKSLHPTSESRHDHLKSRQVPDSHHRDQRHYSPLHYHRPHSPPHRHYPSPHSPPHHYPPPPPPHSPHHYPPRHPHSPTHYLPGDERHFSDSHMPSPYILADDRRYPKTPPDSYRKDGYKNHGISDDISGSNPTMVTDGSITSPDHTSKQATSPLMMMNSNSEMMASNGDKKKMVSRNVDRKKLSEEELEDLRRRERDYQRERRARIRMEKAKLQASHDHYQQPPPPHHQPSQPSHQPPPHDDHNPPSHYYHHTPLIRSPHISGYHDDNESRHHEYHHHRSHREYSPPPPPHCRNSFEDRKDPLTDVRFKGTPIRSSHVRSEDGDAKEKLQVVPKTREFEGIRSSPPPRFMRDETSSEKKIGGIVKKEVEDEESRDGNSTLHLSVSSNNGSGDRQQEQQQPEEEQQQHQTQNQQRQYQEQQKQLPLNQQLQPEQQQQQQQHQQQELQQQELPHQQHHHQQHQEKQQTPPHDPQEQRKRQTLDHQEEQQHQPQQQHLQHNHSNFNDTEQQNETDVPLDELDVKREDNFAADLKKEPTNTTSEERTSATATNTTVTSETGKTSREDMTLRDKIMEEQLERRRRSNREAQRRRRARLKEQENPNPNPDPNRPGQSSYAEYEFVMKESRLMPVYPKSPLPHPNHGNHIVPSKGTCCVKNTPPVRPDTLYPEDYHHGYPPHHPGKLGKLGYNGHAYVYDRLGGHPHIHEVDPHPADKHYYYPAPCSPQDHDHHRRYPHYYRDTYPRESVKTEHRYPPHEVPHHRYGRHTHEVIMGRPTRHVEEYDVKKCARVPSLTDGCDVVTYDEVRNDRDIYKRSSSSSASPSLLSTPRCSETSTDYEPSKQCGRKRKQYAPRKLVSSSSASPEEDVDVCTVRESPEEKFGRVSQGDESGFDERIESPFDRRETSYETRESHSDSAIYNDKNSEEDIPVFKDEGESPHNKYKYQNGEQLESRFNFKEGESPRDKYGYPTNDMHRDKYVYKDGVSPREKYNYKEGGESPLDKYSFKERNGRPLVEKFIFRDPHVGGDSLPYEGIVNTGGITPTNRSHQKLDDFYIYR